MEETSDISSNNIIININQHRFREGRSCLTELMQHYDKLLDDAEKRENTEVIYLDFAKAFDKVNHKILMEKLKKIGVGGKLHSWLASYLTGRTQQVLVGDIKSDSRPILSGIPQGSVLGPLPFIIMMTDIDEDANNVKISSFAGDTNSRKLLLTMMIIIISRIT